MFRIQITNQNFIQEGMRLIVLVNHWQFNSRKSLIEKFESSVIHYLTNIFDDDQGLVSLHISFFELLKVRASSPHHCLNNLFDNSRGQENKNFSLKKQQN